MAVDNYKVYVLTFPNGKVYVGATRLSPANRWRNGKGYENSRTMSKAISQFGWSAVKKEIVAEGLQKDEAFSMEYRLVKELKAKDPKYGYNLADGGKHPKGFRLSEEAKRKISVALKGRKFTEDHKRKIAEAQTGSKNHTFGKKQSAATIEKRRKWNIEHPQDNTKAVEQLSLDGAVIRKWGSISNAARTIGINKTGIIDCCRGKQTTSHGYIWRYAEGSGYE